MLEIEKTYLIKIIPDNLEKYQSFKIKQGYISPSPSPLRIRQKGDKYELTKKLPVRENDFSQAQEINIYLTEFEFNKLWSSTDRTLEKTRYLIPLKDNNLIAELDIFSGPLTGLALVEVEFKNESQMKNFIVPNWFGSDITQKDYASNSFLAGKNYLDIRNLFKE